MTAPKIPGVDSRTANALVPGETRRIVSVSMSRAQETKLNRISDGKRSEFVRAVIDTWPETGRKGRTS